MMEVRDRVKSLRRIKASELKPHPKNWRVHNDSQRSAMHGALAEIGFADALIVRKVEGGFQILDGHLRADEVPDMKVPCLVTDLDDEEAEKFLATYDPIGAMADADQQALGELLAGIEAQDEGLREMLEGLAKQEGIDLCEEAPPEDPGPQLDRAAELQAEWKTELGQLWEIPGKAGVHRVLCGDCRDSDDVARLCTEKVNGCFTSPPYAEQRKEQYGGIPAAEYVDWWEDVQASVKGVMAEEGSFFVNLKPNANGLDTELYVFDLVCAMVRRWRWHFATEFCWERLGVPKGVTRRFKNQFEPIYQFTRGDWKMRPENVRHASSDVPVSLGKGSGNTGWADRQGKGGVIPANRRPRRSGPTMSKRQGESQPIPLHLASDEMIGAGMAYPGNRLPSFASTHEALGHSAAFPPGLPGFFIQAFSDSVDTWLDPFLGSGSTLIACEQLGRIGYGIEISPAYIAVTLQRLKDMGLEPKLVQ